MATKKRPQKKQSNNKFAFLLIIFGILLFSLGTLGHIKIFFNSLVLNFKEQPHVEISVNNPDSISIPSVGLNLQVIQGGIKNREWILSDDKALYLPTSGKIGEGYNTIIYAHSREKLFGNLEKIKVGDVINISDSKGQKFGYSVFSIESVDPTDIDKLYSQEKDIVTLFTCDGWFDEKRLLVRAKLFNISLSTK